MCSIIDVQLSFKHVVILCRHFDENLTVASALSIESSEFVHFFTRLHELVKPAKRTNKPIMEYAPCLTRKVQISLLEEANSSY